MCNDERWPMCLHRTLLVNVKTTWYFQPPSRHHVLCTHTATRNDIFIIRNTNTLVISFVAIFVFTFP
jgi:hypothetical protein